MKVLNVHSRIISATTDEIAEIIGTLATPSDLIWPIGKWPAMKFKDGLEIGNTGGHGPIRYCVSQKRTNYIEFTFSNPKGMVGVHWIKWESVRHQETKIIHCIDMNTMGLATFKWKLVIEPLHNALIEDAFDQLENRFSSRAVKTPWSPYVHSLRGIYRISRRVASMLSLRME
ncbi:MAG: hypothetical protein HKN76_12110 [Saprospiraceae bacterium]|nr:hypothetical protein [Saprospiraceae bacterium]